MMAGRKARLYLKGQADPIEVTVVDLMKFAIRILERPYTYYWTKIERLVWID